MAAALQILLKDLRRMVQNPMRTALLFAMPLMLAGIFVLVFGGDGPEKITIRVLVFDEDNSLLSRLLAGAGGSPEMDERLDLVAVGPEGFEMMEQGEASALVHVPKGFTRAYLRGETATINVLKNPAQRFLPQLVEEGVGILAEAGSEASKIFRPELATLEKLMADDAFPSDLVIGAMAAGISGKLRGFEKWLFPPVIDLEPSTVSTVENGPDRTAGILAVVLPGLAMMGVLFLAQSASRDILEDRERGRLRHLLTAPVTPFDYLAGKCLSVLVITVSGFLFLVTVGALAGVDWGPPLTSGLLVLAASLGASGTLVLIVSIAGSERQMDAISTIVIIVWSMLGGAFIPLSQMPAFLKPISSSTLVYWAVDGFSKAIHEGARVGDVLTNLLVLSLAGGVFLILGAAILGRKMARGVL